MPGLNPWESVSDRKNPSDSNGKTCIQAFLLLFVLSEAGNPASRSSSRDHARGKRPAACGLNAFERDRHNQPSRLDAHRVAHRWISVGGEFLALRFVAD